MLRRSLKRPKRLIIDRYRKRIRFIKLIDSYRNQICLVCHVILFHGYCFKLLKKYYSSRVFDLYNYKDNFNFVLVRTKNQNYLYNYKDQKLLKNNIFFFFKNFNEIYLFLYRVNFLSLSPFFFNPIFFFRPYKKILLTFNKFSFFFKKYKYNYYLNSYFFNIQINFIKKVFLILFFYLFKIYFK